MTDLAVDEWADQRPDDEPLDRLDVIELRLDELGRQLHAKKEKEQPRPPKHRTLEQFVVEGVLSWYRRDAGGRGLRWCAEWTRHPEAVLRFQALWRSFEAVRDPDPEKGDDTWMSSWIRDHVDHHMSRLLDPTGPFGSCTPTEHRDPLPVLRTVPADPQWWTEADTGL